MVFSSSPGIAFAVTAMIGRSAYAGMARMAAVAVYPSISGIITSISTMSTSGCPVSVSIPARPFSACSTVMPWSSSMPVSA